MVVLKLNALIYILVPMMMLIEVFSYTFNQRLFVKCFEKLNCIDETLLDLNITVNYKSIKNLSIWLSVTMLSIHCILVYQGVTQYNIPTTYLATNAIPVIVCEQSKIWFMIFVINLQLKLQSITNYLTELVEIIKRDNEAKENDFSANLQNTIYLHKVIVPRLSKRSFFNQMQFHRMIRVRESPINSYQQFLSVIYKLHGEIYESMKMINAFFSISLLMFTAYIFLHCLTQVFYVYINFMNQDGQLGIELFRLIVFQVLYLFAAIFPFSISAYFCWYLGQNSNKLIIEMFRLANVVDDSNLYDLVSINRQLARIQNSFHLFQLNQLSGHLFHRQMIFTANDFFTFNSSTNFKVLPFFVMLFIQQNDILFVISGYRNGYFLRHSDDSIPPCLYEEFIEK